MPEQVERVPKDQVEFSDHNNVGTRYIGETLYLYRRINWPALIEFCESYPQVCVL